MEWIMESMTKERLMSQGKQLGSVKLCTCWRNPGWRAYDVNDVEIGKYSTYELAKQAVEEFAPVI